MKLIDKLKLCLRILKEEPGNLMAHAEHELIPANGDEMQELMNSQIKELVLVFCTHGHSGFSSAYAIGQLEKILRFEPLRPLTGEDDEWVEVSSGVLQNIRCSHVFKTDTEGAYDMNGKVFREKNGTCYMSRDSKVPVNFPYTPVTEYVDVD